MCLGEVVNVTFKASATMGVSHFSLKRKKLVLGRFQFWRWKIAHTHPLLSPLLGKVNIKSWNRPPSLKIVFESSFAIIAYYFEKKKYQEEKNVKLQCYQSDFFVCFQVKLVKIHPILKHDPDTPQRGSRIYFHKWIRILKMLLAWRKFCILGQVVFHMTLGTLK